MPSHFWGHGLRLTIYFFDPNDESVTTICDINTDYSIISLTTLPAPLPNYQCLPACVSDAGELPQTGPIDVCSNNIFNFSPATMTTLEANDVRRMEGVLASDKFVGRGERCIPEVRRRYRPKLVN